MAAEEVTDGMSVHVAVDQFAVAALHELALAAAEGLGLRLAVARLRLLGLHAAILPPETANPRECEVPGVLDRELAELDLSCQGGPHGLSGPLVILTARRDNRKVKECELTQKIAGDLGEAAQAFKDARQGIPVPPVIVVPIRMRRQVRLRAVNEPGGYERHPSMALDEAAAERRQAIRSARMKRRMEGERKTRRDATFAQAVSRPFKAKKRGTCKVCHKRFGPKTLIAKSRLAGYVHASCATGFETKRELSTGREATVEAIRASKYSRSAS